MRASCEPFSIPKREVGNRQCYYSSLSLHSTCSASLTPCDPVPHDLRPPACDRLGSGGVREGKRSTTCTGGCQRTDHYHIIRSAQMASSKFQAFWNHPAGPKTIHFWAPTFKWCLNVANVAEFVKPPEEISYPQQLEKLEPFQRQLRIGRYLHLPDLTQIRKDFFSKEDNTVMAHVE